MSLIQMAGLPGARRSAQRAGAVASPWAIALIVFFSLIFYFLYHQLPNLHDIAHYIVAGISMARDHHPLIYPYSPMDPSPGWSAYNYFQDNSRLAPLYKAYPSQLYSALFGIYYLIVGSPSFAFGQFLSISAFTAGNVLFYLVGVRLFGRTTGLLFVFAIVLIPVVGAILYPSNDSFAYLCCAVLLWGCVNARMRPFLLGVVVGISGHLRSQALELIIVVPLLILAHRHTLSIWRLLTQYLAGVLVTYILIGQVLSIWQGGHQSAEGAGLDFYIQYFRNALPVMGLREIGARLLHNTIALPKSTLLFFLVFTGLGCIFFRTPSDVKALAGAGLLIVAVPLLIYSIDPFSNPHPRYYVMAVPLLVLAWFRWMIPSGVVSANGGQIGAVVFTTVLSLMAWLHLYGVPTTTIASWQVIRDRWMYPDPSRLGQALAKQFSADDLIITNHALVSALSPVRNFLPYPAFSDFMAGDNREVDGLVFVYGTYPPDDFFKPRDWMENGELPPMIEDSHGVKFRLIAREAVQMPNSAPGSRRAVELVVYKNTRPTAHELVDGKRVYHVEHFIPNPIMRTEDPMFNAQSAWTGKFEKASRGGVIVGPGSGNRNVLTQEIVVKPGEPLLLSVLASAYGRAKARGRLQVNWFDRRHQFLSADIAVFDATGLMAQYQRKVIVPAGAHAGVLVVTPDRDNDVLRFERAEILGHGTAGDSS